MHRADPFMLDEDIAELDETPAKKAPAPPPTSRPEPPAPAPKIAEAAPVEPEPAPPQSKPAPAPKAKRGRPKSANPKRQITLRLDTEIIDHFKAGGRGWQTRINGALREAVGIIDVSNFAKYRIRGAGSADYLDRLVANHVPTEIGRSCLTPMIGLRGGIAGDFTITKLAEDDFLMIGSGIAERYHQRRHSVAIAGVYVGTLSDEVFDQVGPSKVARKVQRGTSILHTRPGPTRHRVGQEVGY